MGNQLFPVETYRETFHRPDLVQRALGGESLADLPVLTTAMVPPLVKIVAPEPNAAMTTGEVTVTLTTTAQAKITAWEVLVNGRPPLSPQGRGIALEARGIALGDDHAVFAVGHPVDELSQLRLGFGEGHRKGHFSHLERRL